MKITNMEEMGKAIDDGKELEILNSRGVDDKEEWWGEIRDSLCWMNMPLLVSEGRIRTKPKTITLYEYYIVGASYHFWDVNDGNKTFLGKPIARSGTKPITTELEE